MCVEVCFPVIITVLLRAMFFSESKTFGIGPISLQQFSGIATEFTTPQMMANWGMLQGVTCPNYFNPHCFVDDLRWQSRTPAWMTLAALWWCSTPIRTSSFKLALSLAEPPWTSAVIITTHLFSHRSITPRILILSSPWQKNQVSVNLPWGMATCQTR